MCLACITACTAADTDNATPPDSTVVTDTAADSTVAPADAPQVDSAAPKLPPVDQADSSFGAFRAATLAALSRQDTAYLYRILAPEIRNSFGGDDSIAGFKRLWHMERPAESDVWAALTRVLEMGGEQPTDTTFIAPYVFALWPDTLDSFEHVAVTEPDAPLRDSASANAPVIGRLSHSILKVEDWHNLNSGITTDSTWARVTVPGGPSGWVSGSDVYSPVNWRAFFVKRGGRWLMQLFVAGD